MTLEQTRQLGIEFERRVQTMIPEKEYLDKLDTDTIYAYLNSYQDKYIHDIYRNLDKIQSGSKLSAHVESVLQEMLRTQTISILSAKDNTRNIEDPNGITIIENGRSVTYPLDPAFYMYIRSVSNVTSTYSFRGYNDPSQPIRVLPNELVSQSDVWRLLETPHNSLRILRYPAATIGAYEDFPGYKIELVDWGDINPLYDLDKVQEFIQQLTEGSAGSCDIRNGFTKDELNSRYSRDQILNEIVNRSDADRSALSDGLDEMETTGKYILLKRIKGHQGGVVIYEFFKVTVLKNRKVPTLNVIYDQYTTPTGIKIMYYAQPQRFNPMTKTLCELPMDAFDDLVTGAVDLYVQYVAGAEANKRRLQEVANQQQKQQRNKEED